LIFILLLISSRIFGQNSLDRLNSKTDFESFSGLPLVEKYGEVSAIKLVYELKTKEIYYINSRYFRYHHEFCGYKLENDVDLLQDDFYTNFNKVEEWQQMMILASLERLGSLLKVERISVEPEEEK